MSDEAEPIPFKRPRVEMIEFDGDQLIAVVLEGDGVAIPMRILCEVLGLDPQSQVSRLREHEVLSQGLRVVNVRIGDRVRSTIALLHMMIPFYLATISPHQVAESVRPKLVRYQQELVVILSRIFYGEDPYRSQMHSSNPELAALQQRIDAALHELYIARDTYLAAQRQTESRVDEMAQQLTTISEIVGDLQQAARISAAQAEYLQRALKRIAVRYQKKTGREIFGKLFAQFAIDLGTPRYDTLPATKYQNALDWLQQKADEFLPGDTDALPPAQELLL